MHKANLWTFLKNHSNEIRSNEIRIRWEPHVHQWDDTYVRPCIERDVTLIFFILVKYNYCIRVLAARLFGIILDLMKTFL